MRILTTTKLFIDGGDPAETTEATGNFLLTRHYYLLHRRSNCLLL